MKSLIFIPDFGSDALAVSEVLETIRRCAGAPFFVNVVPARPFNTIHTSFLLAQLNGSLDAAQARETVFFLNTDPRTHTSKIVEAAQGSPLLGAFLKNQVLAISPNAGFCFSFVKDEIEKLYKIKVAADGSQFRSRDIFAPAVAKALAGDIASLLGKELSPEETIPALPEGNFVLHTDNFGNIKLYLQKNSLGEQGIYEGDEIKVAVGEKTMPGVRVSSTIFAIPPGSIVLAPGSSGPKENPYYELSVRFDGHAQQSAGAAFDWPEPGTNVSFFR